MDRSRMSKPQGSWLRCLVGFLTAGLTLASASPAAADEGTSQTETRKATRCHLYFEMDGWSFVYRVVRGEGRIECADGQKAEVKVVAHGGGPSFGTQHIRNGRGRFSGTFDVQHLMGTYIEAEAHGGVGDGAAGSARAMFKGSKRLSLAGGGGGIGVGIVFGGFTVQPR